MCLLFFGGDLLFNDLRTGYKIYYVQSDYIAKRRKVC